MSTPDRLPLLPTTVVGSYPQPSWLVDREKLASRLPPRVRAKDVWRVAEPFLEEAQDDATLLAIRDMERAAAGADVVQVDEPYMQARVEKGRAFAVEAINRALEGVRATTVLHTCFGYGAIVKNKSANAYPFLEELRQTAAAPISIEAAQPKLDLSVLGRMGGKTMVVGVIDLGTEEIETPEVVADRVRAALDHIPAERLVLAPDCGMKYLARQAAFGKLRAMVEGVRRVRREFGGTG